MSAHPTATRWTEKAMKIGIEMMRIRGRAARGTTLVVCALSMTMAASGAMAQAAGAAAQKTATPTAQKTGAAQKTGTAAGQKSFPSAEDTANALVQALKARDRPTVITILGPGSSEWVSSGDAVADRSAAEAFIAAYEQKHAIAPEGDARATLTIGQDDWPFAFPLVKSEKGWRFDTEAGKKELLARRIGKNELAAINVMLAIVDAERDYASEDHNKDGVREYARKFASTPGRKDGLYWPTSSNEPPSPLGALVTSAAGEGYAKKEGPRPYHGYFVRMLKGQGANAKGGALDYVVKGRMIGGFAAIAYPARYANSGVMTFIVNHDGVVYERDLGPETATLARAVTRFDPGPGWTVVNPK
jgi:hypothetical protein